jgi:hypothetical protein
MKSHLVRPTFVGAVLLVAIWVACARCQKPSGGKAGSGVHIASSTDLKPDANPGPQRIVYAGTVIPAETKVNLMNDEFSIELWYNEVSLEKEVYKSSAKEFSLVNAAGEDYAPPIPLLRFPMNAGASFKWSGKMITGPTSRNATALISTREDKVDMGGVTDALVVEVDISMESGANAPATRQLLFWFVKGKGVVKRDFGASTSRVPASSTDETLEPATSTGAVSL